MPDNENRHDLTRFHEGCTPGLFKKNENLRPWQAKIYLPPHLMGLGPGLAGPSPPC